MLIVGLTGGIASGKSTISAYLASLGAVVIDADKIAQEVVQPGNLAWKKIKDEFGSDILQENQEINRAKLAKIIFDNPEKRIALNNIVHPEVIAETNKLIDLYQQDKNIPLVVIDAPLLIEAQMTSVVDQVWVIDVTVEKQIERAMARDNLTWQAAKGRIDAQMPTAEKLHYADRIIDGNKTKEETLEEINKIWSEAVDQDRKIK